ncbi:MAG TPA: hypothetical protein VGM29_01610 [Polyangiaceae bacterium]|jgi:hypothetical protein
MLKNHGSRALLVTALALGVLCGCSSDAKPAPVQPTLTCTNASTPTPFTLTNVMPATGASVPNQAIVQEFTIAPGGAISTLRMGFSAAHTAGEPTTPLNYTESTDATGASTFQFLPVTWPMAGHVEIDVGADEEFQDPTGTTCYTIPNPVFSYDVTAP